MSCIFKTQGGGGGMYASIFVTGLSETDRVKAVYQKKAAKIRTGEFIAGQEVPQYIDEYVDGTVKEGVWTSKLGEVETKGHKISRIKDVGTWRVEGTDGEQTVTEDVEVSTAVEYEVEMKMEPNYLMLYDFGDECVDVTGGWTGKFADSNYITGGSYAKKADNLYLDKTSDGYPTPMFASNNPISFAEYSKVAIVSTYYLKSTTQRLSWYLRVSATASWTTTSNLIGFEPALNSSVTQSEKVLTISDSFDSASIGSKYIFLDLQAGTTSDTRGNVSHYAVFLLKPDDWRTLCMKAGLSAPADLTTLIADMASIEAILNNEAAVKFMVNQCTGDFMASFVANADCIEALHNSPYASMVFANKHWKKFLDMVGVKQRLYLYRAGDECVDVTGGWYKNTNATIYGVSSANGAVEFQDDNLYIASTRNNAVCVTASNRISFANYTKLKFVITGETQDGAAMVGPTMLFVTSANSGDITTDRVIGTYADVDGEVKEVDISSLNDSYYISYATNGDRTGHLKRLWLE